MHSHYFEPTKRKSHKPAWLSGNNNVCSPTTIVLKIQGNRFGSTQRNFKNLHKQQVFIMSVKKIRKKIRKDILIIILYTKKSPPRPNNTGEAVQKEEIHSSVNLRMNAFPCTAHNSARCFSLPLPSYRWRSPCARHSNGYRS